MMYLIVLFIPPLYFLLRQQWLGLALNSVLYFFAVTLIVVGIGIIPWALAVGHASWHLRREFALEHAKAIAQEMAKVMKEKG